MERISTFCSPRLKKIVFLSSLVFAMHGFSMANTIALHEVLDEHNRITNPQHLSGTVDFTGFNPVLDECEGIVFLPASPLLAPQWNPLGPGLNLHVIAIAISGTNVYVGGGFTNAGGNADADYIARWDGSSWHAVGSGLNSDVYTIAISGSHVYVGGNFTDAGGDDDADYIARWDGSSWNALGPGLNLAVLTIAVSGGNVYAGGIFTDAGGDANADYIARWDGSSWNALGTGVNNDVYAIVVSGSNVYVGGFFTNAGGIDDADYIACWNGSSWSALGAGLNWAVLSIGISGSDVYAGGIFTDAGGNANADYIARWNGSSWNALDSGLDGGVITIAISGGNVYTGGWFTNAGGNANADRIAYWNGSSWNALGSGMNNEVWAIAVSGSDVYAGGIFTDAGGFANGDFIALWGEPLVLPVELSGFHVVAHKNYAALLTWHTASEMNNSGFFVERSADGRNWETLSFVQGHGTTFTEQSYSFLDEQTLPGVNYYRLKQTDYEGKFEYSEVKSVVLQQGTKNGISIYPNPVGRRELTVFLSGKFEQDATLRLYSPSGKLLRQEVISENVHKLGMYGLPAGVYLLEIISGKEVWRERVVVE